MERYGGGGVVAEVLLETRMGEIEVAVLRTSFAPGAIVPLHAHPEAEEHHVEAGHIEFYHEGTWTDASAGTRLRVAPGDFHAMRNTGPNVAAMLTLLPGSLLAYVREVAPPLDGTPAAQLTSDAAVAHVAERRSRGYVNASPVDNAAIGIMLPPKPSRADVK